MVKKLKQLENQSLPDLSKMDEHWKNLRDSLQPKDSLPKERTNKSFIRWIIAASLAGILFFASYKFIFNINDDRHVAAEVKPVPAINNISKDTLPSINLVPGKDDSVVLGKDTIRFIMQKEKPKPPQLILKGKNSDGKEIEVIAVPVNDTINKKPEADKKKIIQDFFAELEKEKQSFVVNNQKDTVIWGKEGTALLIPANVFGGSGAVTITMKEYYSYKDIITNQLTTCSDNRLLISGGMLHITATINGKEADIQPNKSIRWFMPDTSKSSMQNMQLFNGEIRDASLRRSSETSDTMVVDYTPGNINWVPQMNYFTGNYFYTYVRVLDLRDEPIKTRTTKSGKVGKFYIAPDATITKAELEDYLVTKRGYARVIIREKSDVRRMGFPFRRRYRLSNQALGDSVWVELSTARRYNFAVSDTIVTTTPVRGWYDFYVYDGKRPISRFDTAFSKQNLNNLANKFSVDIRTLGWVNCDEFLRDTRPKVDYVVKLSEPATDYYTVLVFDRIKSMMNGFTRGDQVTFSNLPLGEPVTIISVGVKEGKPVAAMHKTLLSKTIFDGLQFEETTPAEFKEKTGTMDKP